MHRWTKAVAAAGVVLAMSAAGAVALASPVPPAITQPAHHGKHHTHGWHVQRVLAAIDRNPQQAAERLQKVLARVQQREQKLTATISAERQKLPQMQDAARKEIAEAALAVRSAELTRLQKLQTAIGKALTYAQQKAAQQPAPSGSGR